MKKIQKISSKDTFSVRHLVLRVGKPIESCQFDGDDLESSAHFGLLVDEKLIGVVSLFKNNNAVFNCENQYQIRGMAVLPEFQRKNYGQELVKQCEVYCKMNKASLIWFNAREHAVSFYKKLDYDKIGSPFNVSDIGLHYLMNKNLEYHE
jgi:predicted GNAT family N-acyltransferase